MPTAIYTKSGGGEQFADFEPADSLETNISIIFFVFK
jgi:hypothetical protein